MTIAFIYSGREMKLRNEKNENNKLTVKKASTVIYIVLP